MNKRLFLGLFAALNLFSLGFSKSASALQDSMMDTPVSTEELQTSDMTLANLGFSNAIVLNGPYQEVAAVFSLPPDWKITGETVLELQVQVEFQSVMEAFASDNSAYQPVNQKGVLRISVNDTSLPETILKNNGVQVLNFVIPADSLKENMAENRIAISWDTAEACGNDVMSSLAIDSKSIIHIPHEAKANEMALTDFPKPFYDEAAIRKYPTAIILVDPENETDLSALMAVSAGLGKQSAGKMNYSVFTADEAQNEDLADDQIILIGLTEPVSRFLGENKTGFADAISVPEINKDAGLIWYGSSPWNPGRTMMIISGSDAPSLLKGSAVIANDHLVPFSGDNLAVISELASTTPDEQLKVDYLLGDLLPEGASLHVDRLGVSNMVIPFHVPGDVKVNSEAYVELYFRHSQLLNYLRSGLSVSINGRRIGTVRFSDNTAENGLVRILLPPNVILPQKNELELTFTLTGQDLCADERSGDYWVTVFDQSYLHLPPELSAESQTPDTSFTSLPGLFLRGKGMEDITFTAAENKFDNWRYAAQIAFIMGGFSDELILTPKAVLIQSLISQKATGNVVLIGTNDSIPDSEVVSNWQPVPINSSTELSSLMINGTRFDIFTGNDYGFLELGVDPQSGNHFLSIMGNSPSGLENAFRSFKDLIILSDKPAENVRIINSQGKFFGFLVEKTVSQITTETQSGRSWRARLSALNVNDTAGMLLVMVGMITIVFLSWTLADARKKHK